MTVKTLNDIANNTIQAIPQDENLAKELPHAPKIFKQDCKIDWNESAQAIHNKIRGLSPYPAAWCTLKNEKKNEVISFKLFTSKLIEEIPTSEVLVKHTDGILFPCKDGFVCISELQPEGKRRMNFKEFLAGNSLEDLSKS